MDLKKKSFRKEWTGLIWLNIWIDLVQDRDQQLDLVEEAMNLLVPQNARNF